MPPEGAAQKVVGDCPKLAFKGVARGGRTERGARGKVGGAAYLKKGGAHVANGRAAAGEGGLRLAAALTAHCWGRKGEGEGVVPKGLAPKGVAPWAWRANGELATGTAGTGGGRGSRGRTASALAGGEVSSGARSRW